jgi:two-component system, OmpR family, sensor kinase
MKRKIFPFDRTSLRTRLMLWNMLVLTLVLATLGATLFFTLRTNLLHGVDNDLVLRSDRLLSIINRGPAVPFLPPQLRVVWVQGKQVPVAQPNMWAPVPPGMTSKVLSGTPPTNTPFERFHPKVLRLDGHAFLPGEDYTPWDPHTFVQSISGHKTFSTITLQNELIRIYSRPIVQNNRVIGVLQLAFPLAGLLQDLRSVTKTLIAFIPITLLVAAFGGTLLTDRALKPIRQVTKTAARLGVHDLSERLPVSGEDEFAELAVTFNGMLGRLEHSFEELEQAYRSVEHALDQQRRFTADASHELRTPLTVILGSTSMALSRPRSVEEYKIALQRTDKAAKLMSTLVQDLLLLARSDAGQLALNMRAIPIHDVLELAIDTVPAAGNCQIRMRESENHLIVLGEPTALTRLFINLIDNAIRHTPADGQIILTASEIDEKVVVTVEDTGIGIAAEHLPFVKERFYRVDSARTRKHGGTGLGLAISQRLVEAHHGVLEIESELGQGTKIIVTLPQAKSMSNGFESGMEAADNRELAQAIAI